MQIDPLADDKVQVYLTPYQFGWNNPIRYEDPLGLCPECEENVTDPTEGQEYVSSGDALYIYQNGDWVRQDNDLGEVVVTGEREYEELVLSEPEGMSRSDKFVAGSLVTVGILLADDATVIGVVDDVAIPFILLAAGIVYTYDQLVVDHSEPIVRSKGGRSNIWPDQYGPAPNVKDVDWGKSDSELANEKSNEVGDAKRGPGSANNKAKKWYRDKRPR